MKNIYSLIYFLFFSLTLQAQVNEALNAIGMENIRSTVKNGVNIVAFEDNVYRGTYRGVGKAIIACLNSKMSGDLEMVVLENEIPRICISLPDSLTQAYREGKISLAQIYSLMNISVNTDKAITELKGLQEKNKSSWKADIVIYPQLYLENSRFDRLYTYAVSFAPALEMSLWKGAMLTAQVILPAATNTNGEYEKIHPGIIALAQEFRWKKNFFGRLITGNFTNNRIGLQTEINYRSNSGRFEVGALIGSTGYSMITDNNKWYIGTDQRINASIKGTLYVPQFNTQLDLQVGRYLYGDMGIRGDCTRHFGEYAVGVYAMCSNGEINGGFHFAIPLPGTKWNRKHGIRIKPSEYFSWVYSMVSWGKYVDEKMGRTYSTRLDDNKSSRFYQPDFIRYFLIKELQK